MTLNAAERAQANKVNPTETHAPVNAGDGLYEADYDGLHRSLPRIESTQRILSQSDYVLFRAFVQDRIGLDVTEDRRPMLARALSEEMEISGLASLEELHRLLQISSNTSPVWDRLVSALTIGETYFFRNTGHFDALAKKILPDLLIDREHSSRRIRIWSAGCATGEEPYSIAIMLNELIPNRESWNISILATDINRDELRRAREGVYSAWSFRGVERRVQETYFQLNDQKQFAISEKIKRMVTFEYLNLVGDPFPSLANNTNAMDIILCRNVTIYFTPAVTRQVLANFHACLTDGGWLIPGASEPNMVFYKEFEPRNFPSAVIYQRPAKPKIKVAPAFTFLPATAAMSAPAPVPASRPIKQPAPAPSKPPEVQAPRLCDAYKEAIELLHNDKANEALAKLHEKLAQDPGFIPAYYTLGKIYANQGNLEEAQTWCERAIAKDKLHPEPYYTLSLVYQQIGMIEQAMNALKKTIYLDRSFVLAHYNLAQNLQHQGEKALARKSLLNVQKLLEGQPRDG
ncbi:MAG TPA: CheR family methyltransferase, partial [Anaerolineae bacterium]